jgi:hypothetical protein
MLERLLDLYDAALLMKEWTKMRLWLDGSPKRRKTPNGMSRFIVGWMSRREKPYGPPAPPPTQRQIDFKDFTETQY